MAVIRQRTQVINQPIGVARASRGGVQLGQAISQFANEITDTTFRMAAEDAQKRGIETAQAIEDKNLRTFNPETGKPEAYEAPKGFGRIAASAYQSVVDKRFEDSMESELRLKAAEIAQKYSYNPQGYEKVMSEYIASMSENAQGKYKTFITDNGTKFLASTKLNIQARATARARANLTQSIVTGLDRASDEAYNVALAGGYLPAAGELTSEADDLSGREVANVANGVASGLLKNGADAKAKTQIRTAIARGGVEHVISKTTSAADRNAVELAIRTRGREVASVPVELRPQVESLIRYIEPANIEQVLKHSATVSADYNAVERDNIAAKVAASEAQARREAMMFRGRLEDYAVMSGTVASRGFASEEPYAVSSSIAVSNTLFESVTSNLDQRFIENRMTEAEYNSSLQSARQDMLRPYLVEAAAQGNVEELRVAAITKNPADMSALSPKQREFVYAMHESQLFNAAEDTGFVREVLAANTNSIRVQREEQQDRFNFSQEITDLGAEAAISGISEERYSEMSQRLADKVGYSFTAEQAEAERSRLNQLRAFGDINVDSAGMSARELNQLSTYVQTQGQSSEGASERVVALGNKILSKTTAEDSQALTGRIDSIRVKVAREEEARQKLITKQENIARIASGGGNANSSEDRKLADEMLAQIGVNVRTPESETEEVLSLLRSVQPQSMIDDFKAIAAGLQVQGAEVLLNHFSRLSNDVDRSGSPVNRFGDALPAEDQEMLNDIVSIRANIGGSVNEIAATLAARRDDPKSDLYMKRTLSGKTPTTYVLERTNGWFSSPDPIIAAELAPAVEYLARTGKSAEQINGRLELLINQGYPKSEYIADPRAPVGSIKRSKFALVKTIPEEADRDEFLRIIESSLPAGYSLFADAANAERDFGVSMGVAPSDEERVKQIMLSPYEDSAGVTYATYYVDQFNELQPLILPRENGPYQPAFDMSDLDAFRKQRAAEEAESLKQDTLAAENHMNKLRKAAREADFGTLVSPY